MEIVPKDGVRRRFHALVAGQRLHLTLDQARFASGRPLFLTESLDRVAGQLERTDDRVTNGRLTLRSSSGGTFSIRAGDQASRVVAKADEDIHINLPLGATLTSVSIERAI